MTSLIGLVAMSLPSWGDGRPLPYYYPQVTVLIHDFLRPGLPTQLPARILGGLPKLPLC
jgi:hypothetical protein